jgi:hypothetical protein
MMIAIAACAGVLGYLGSATKLGSGSATVALRLHIVDDSDGSPVPGARISVIRECSAPLLARTTTEANVEGSDQISSLVH